MTEVPEHLLKKAAEARARLSGEGGDAADADTPPAGDAPAAAATPAPVAATPAVPAEPEPPAPPVPDAPYVAAAKARKTIPVWVMPMLLFLPIWAIYYVGYLERPPAEGGLAVEGVEAYASCAGCHGAGGGGGSGRQLNEGEVIATFPVGVTASGYDGLAGQIAWVANGSNTTATLEGSTVYGDPDRAGGPHQVGDTGAVMSGFGSLGLEQIVAVVYHERAQFGGLEADVAEEELELLEEFIVIREELGDEDLEGETVAEVHEGLEEARAALGLEGGAE